MAGTYCSHVRLWLLSRMRCRARRARRAARARGPRGGETAAASGPGAARARAGAAEAEAPPRAAAPPLPVRSVTPGGTPGATPPSQRRLSRVCLGGAYGLGVAVLCLIIWRLVTDPSTERHTLAWCGREACAAARARPVPDPAARV